MGAQPPFMYQNVRSSAPFDPKAVSRASFNVRPQRPKHDGPLVSFNQHPDSYMVVPTGLSATPMKSSTKKWIKWLRIVQLVLRVLCLIGAMGLLVIMIMLRGMEDSIGWLMRIAPGVAILHSFYGVYHLSRKASGRTPASSASYMLFASFFDVSLLPCYAFSALITYTKSEEWSTIIKNQELTPEFIKVAFYTYSVAGGLHAITLALAINLAVTFRRITQLPPDMNPLEDNLTSRHKRNKSSMSTISTDSAFTKRGSAISEKRAPASAYEDLRQPTIPFFHTRQQSTDSFSTYSSTNGPSNDSRSDLPSRQYGSGLPGSPRASVSDLKRASYYDQSTPPKSRDTFVERPLTGNSRKHGRQGSDVGSMQSQSPRRMGNVNEAWYTTDSLNSPNKSALQKQGPKGGQYQPVNPYDDDISLYSVQSSQSNRSNNTTSRQPQAQSHQSRSSFSHPNPVASNPPTPKRSRFPGDSIVSTNSPLSEMSTNKRSVSLTKDAQKGGDIADSLMSEHQIEHRDRYDLLDDETDLGAKSKGYGALKSGKPPVMVGNGKLGVSVGGRQVSSGNDFASTKGGKRREFSGKVAEEGRANPWGARLRKVSGILM